MNSMQTESWKTAYFPYLILISIRNKRFDRSEEDSKQIIILLEKDKLKPRYNFIINIFSDYSVFLAN